MLRHDFHETLVQLEETISEGLDRLEEYGVQFRRKRAGSPHTMNATDPRSGSSVGFENSARWLAIGAGITIGLTAGLIALGYARSRSK